MYTCGVSCTRSSRHEFVDSITFINFADFIGYVSGVHEAPAEAFVLQVSVVQSRRSFIDDSDAADAKSKKLDAETLVPQACAKSTISYMYYLPSGAGSHGFSTIPVNTFSSCEARPEQSCCSHSRARRCSII